jgi:hypothetical protein
MLATLFSERRYSNTICGEKCSASNDILGLPSSKIFNTNISLVNDFHNGFTVIEFTVFLLGWIAGDGSVTWTYRDKKLGTASLRYQGVVLTARCPDIMDVLASHMNQRGFYDIFTGTTPDGMNRLRIPVNTINNGLLLDGITHMEANGVTVHSKLRFLKEFLTSPNVKISEAFGPPWRYSFHQYLGPDYEMNRLACLLGQ